jgi:hypothetical protein
MAFISNVPNVRLGVLGVPGVLGKRGGRDGGQHEQRCRHLPVSGIERFRCDFP